MTLMPDSLDAVRDRAWARLLAGARGRSDPFHQGVLANAPGDGPQARQDRPPHSLEGPLPAGVGDLDPQDAAIDRHHRRATGRALARAPPTTAPGGHETSGGTEDVV